MTTQVQNEDAIVNPQKTKHSPAIGPLAVMTATRGDLFDLCDLLEFKKEAFQRVFNSRLYFDRSGSENFSLTGPFVGAPYAVMLLETLIAWGAGRIIFLGWCGAVSENVKIGDIVLPTSAVIDEGTSPHYGVGDNDRIQAPFPMVSRIQKTLESNHADFHAGPVWSTDAVYRETRRQVETHRQNGVLAVDMEMSALYAAAQFRRVDLGGILVVSDELSSFNWRPGFRHERFIRGRQFACKVVAELCRA